jgi:hypothetical protein
MNNKNKIINDILDKEAYSSTYPSITNSKYGALHEIHIFLLPLNPTPSLIENSMSLTDKYNSSGIPDLQDYKMKMCYLTLVFRNSGPVKVLQSARYFRSNDQNEVIRQAYLDANFFVENGFDVIRVKIEANANSNQGIPLEIDEALKFPKYFEFHVKVQHKNARLVELITEEESAELLTISKRFTKKFGTPVPISWNNVANCDNPDNPGFQRFLNVRYFNFNKGRLFFILSKNLKRGFIFKKKGSEIWDTTKYRVYWMKLKRQSMRRVPSK